MSIYNENWTQWLWPDFKGHNCVRTVTLKFWLWAGPSLVLFVLTSYLQTEENDVMMNLPWVQFGKHSDGAWHCSVQLLYRTDSCWLKWHLWLKILMKMETCCFWHTDLPSPEENYITTGRNCDLGCIESSWWTWLIGLVYFLVVLFVVSFNVLHFID